MVQRCVRGATWAGALAGVGVLLAIAGPPAIAQSQRVASDTAVSRGDVRSNSVTYVGNSGFLIWVGNRKILVDALFEGIGGGYAPPAAVRAALLDARPPFDGIDLVLATHTHGDHFTASLVRQCLKDNPRAVFAGPVDAVEAVTKLGGRGMALRVPDGGQTTFEVNGISVKAFPISHGNPPPGVPGIVNLAYLISVGGKKFLHPGDIDASLLGPAQVRAWGLPAERIDVAFVQHFLLGIQQGPIPLVVDGIAARYVAVSHLQYTGGEPDYAQIGKNFPNAILFRNEMESWTIR
jgi:L-ascorbate metabolism protein UlaG (beta-lactamase superfamily)